MVLDIALVGTGGMMPLPNRWLSSVLLRYGRHLVLFDCGEGTQISLRMLGWGLKDIDLVIVSHLHGDHIAGLPGLLLTQGNSGRTEPLEIVGPPGLKHVVDSLRVVAPHLPFEVRVRELRAGDCFEVEGLVGTCVEAQHQVPCLAYRLEVRRGPRFLPERARALSIPIDDWKRLQRGQSVNGIHPNEVLGPPRPGIAVGLVTDTRPTAEIAQLVSNVDLLVCEAMYGSDDDQPRAVERGHMTFREAATLARDANANMLLLTHFSPSVVEPDAYAPNAHEVFPKTVVGRDRLTFSLGFPAD
jgi:ribonuclease Z